MKPIVKFVALLTFCLLMGACSGDTYLHVGDAEGKTEITFGADAATALLTINCSKEWTISSSADWCKYSMSSGNKTEIITLSVSDNDTGEVRQCTLTVRAEDESVTVHVTQRASDPYKQ